MCIRDRRIVGLLFSFARISTRRETSDAEGFLFSDRSERRPRKSASKKQRRAEEGRGRRGGRTVTSTGMMRSVERALSVGAPLMGSITPEGARKLENHCVSGEGSGRSERLPSSRWRRKRRRAAWSVERRAVTREARGTHVVRLAEGVAEEGVGGEGEGHGGEWRRRFRSRARVSARKVVASRGETRDRKVVVSRHPSCFGYRPRRACLGRVRRVEIRTPRPRSSPEARAKKPKLASSTDTFSQTLV